MNVKQRPEVSKIDWARLAMAIDGEGTITTGRYTQDGCKEKNTGILLFIIVSNSDPRLCHWCKETFGGGVFYAAKPRTDKGHYGKKQVFMWKVHSATAEWVLRNCLPYFVIKREQAEVALSLRAIKVPVGQRGFTEEQKFERQRLRTELSRLKREYPTATVQ